MSALFSMYSSRSDFYFLVLYPFFLWLFPAAFFHWLLWSPPLAIPSRRINWGGSAWNIVAIFLQTLFMLKGPYLCLNPRDTWSSQDRRRWLQGTSWGRQKAEAQQGWRLEGEHVQAEVVEGKLFCRRSLRSCEFTVKWKALKSGEKL